MLNSSFTRVIASVVVVGAMLGLTACSGGDNDVPPTADTKVVNYNGYALTCVTWRGSHAEEGLTCDFVSYHQEQTSAPEDAEQVSVVKRTFEGREIPCVTWRGSHSEEGLACDFTLS